MTGFIHLVTPNGIKETIKYKRGTKLNHSKHLAPYRNFVCPRNFLTGRIDQNFEFYSLPNVDGAFKSNVITCVWDDNGRAVERIDAQGANPILTSMLRAKLKNSTNDNLPEAFRAIKLRDYYGILGLSGTLPPGLTLDSTLGDLEDWQLADAVIYGNALVIDNFRQLENGEEIAA